MLRFGTDGVRGDADTDLTTPLIVALGRAAARVLGAETFLIGRDTRESGPRIEADLARGLAAEGAERRRRSAWRPRRRSPSSRSAPARPPRSSRRATTRGSDNGVKLVGADGRKLADDAEAAIEAELQSLSSTVEPASQSRLRRRLCDAG